MVRSRDLRGRFGVRDTGIIREVVPLDESALATYVEEDVTKPCCFLECCKEYRSQALALLRRRGFPADPKICKRLPQGEFDAKWLALPVEVEDAFRLVLEVDSVERLFDDPKLIQACRSMGKKILDRSHRSPFKAPPADLRRLHLELGQRQIAKIAGRALRIGELRQKLLVRPREKYARGGIGRLKALKKATRISVESRRQRAEEKRAARARAMRRLMEQGMSRSSAARHLDRNRADLGRYTSFYNSIIPSK